MRLCDDAMAARSRDPKPETVQLCSVERFIAFCLFGATLGVTVKQLPKSCPEPWTEVKVPPNGCAN
jgi:hypothetical protein